MLQAAPHVLLVVAPYYTEIVEDLCRGAVRALEEGGATWERVDVAGAFEIPAAIAIALDAEARGGTRFDGYLGLGCVIRGETSHYDLICNEVAHALQTLAVERLVAVGFGLLTTENGEQARVRAAPEGKDKGREAVRACLGTIALKRRFAVGGK
ncbi:MAG: 6,7-dimethyl-8-ribityllumazine synthase [Alphaproteobacteria bacterium]